MLRKLGLWAQRETRRHDAVSRPHCLTCAHFEHPAGSVFIEACGSTARAELDILPQVEAVGDEIEVPQHLPPARSNAQTIPTPRCNSSEKANAYSDALRCPHGRRDNDSSYQVPPTPPARFENPRRQTHAWKVIDRKQPSASGAHDRYVQFTQALRHLETPFDAAHKTCGDEAARPEMSLRFRQRGRALRSRYRCSCPSCQVHPAPGTDPIGCSKPGRVAYRYACILHAISPIGQEFA